jgi:DNA-directed RNA polymerase subunit omega|tara:strand:+ start:193 stop:471 length:279 start_codon:yes stop_codon:yes gene_type:complete
MARITVEDCTKNVDSLFDLVLVASHRAKVLNSGNEAYVPIDNDKSTVVALREIAEEKIDVKQIQEDIVKSHQLIQEKEEENEDHLLDDTNLS